MKLRISHRTEYAYGRPIVLEPHLIRLRPREDGAQVLRSFECSITPEPRLRSENLDAEGNVVIQAWFAGETDQLLVETACEVDTLRTNPYDFLLTDEEIRYLPSVYSAPRQSLLAVYAANATIDAGVRALAESVAASVRWETLGFLPALSERIFKMCRHVPRDEGPPRPAAVTLATREGACRDLAVLFIEACRSQGLAARFVSGYQENGDDWESHEMHAWAEIYLPGGGWRGFDPTHGVAAGESLVVVAAALDSAGAAPVDGTFRGDGVSQRMSFLINVHRVDTG